MTSTPKILLVILIFVLLLAGLQHAIRFYTSPQNLGDHSDNPEPLDISVGKTTLRIPMNMIRRKKHRRAGIHSSIDLYFQWPSLKGYSLEDAQNFEGQTEDGQLILATIEEAPIINTHERRLTGIYQRFFTGKPWRGPDGLIGQSLDPTSGYQSEDVYFGRNNGNLFTTRCLQEKSAKQFHVLPTCLYDFQLDDNVIVILRYHRNILSDWRAIETNLKRHIISMRTQ